ncbi:MAG: type-F conjugative transfer system pilin assembly protein TrbC [Candidatus Manganitrophaceae bacterium]
MNSLDFPRNHGRWLWIVFVVVGLAACFNVSLASKREAHAEIRAALIEAPNPCHQLKEVDGSAVFLESTENICVQVISKIPVEIDSSIKTVQIHVDGRFWKEQVLTEFKMEEVNHIAKRAEEIAKNLKVPKNQHQHTMQSEAEKLAQMLHSKAYQKKLQAETERIKETLFKEQRDQAGPIRTEEAGKRGTGRYLLPSERIYLFISSTMPMTTLRNYANDLGLFSDPNIQIVMRGMVGGMKYVQPTTEFVSKITVKDTHCKLFREECAVHPVNVFADPFLFRRYRIDRVPAVVYVRGLSVIDPIMSEGPEENAKMDDYHIIYGDSSLEYVLKKIYQETNAASLDKILKAMKGKK